MSPLVRNGLILLFILIACVLAIFPVDEKLRKGKDIAGGFSLIYGVTLSTTDETGTLGKVATDIHDRLDPDNALEVSVMPLGDDRIEITMPLPTAALVKLKKEVDAELEKVKTASVTKSELERIAGMDEAEQAARIKAIGGDDPARREKLEKAVKDFAAVSKARGEYEPARTQVKFIEEQIRSAGGENSSSPVVPGLKDALKTAKEKADALLMTAAGAEVAYEKSVTDAVTTGLNAEGLRSALSLSDRDFRLPGKDGKVVTLESPRKRAIAGFVTDFPAQAEAIKNVEAKWNQYEKSRKGLDDPQDVQRILKGAGVLTFRITVNAGELANEQEMRDQLKAGGPLAVKFPDAKFFEVNKIEQWVQNVEDLKALKESPAAFFAQRRLVAEEHKGTYYVLCWDKRGLRLTPDDGEWKLSRSYPGSDNLGRPAIDFEMDVLGADKLGRLTGGNVGKNMAVLLDDEVYTAPTLQSQISNRGQITGSFSTAEIDYVVRVLGAGAMKNKLSENPVGQSVVGPQFGADNLEKGIKAGLISFIVVGAFMIAYYFGGGVIAIVALAFNALLLVAAMALNQAAFSLPGIAGIMLTFGQAVDANVLIYERMREEFRNGADLRTAVRLGFSKAFSAIVDGNVTTFIVCVMLYIAGTQEIRGFALTLGIGVVTTLFAQLFFTRFIYDLLVEKFHVRKMSMLPLVIPGWQEWITPTIDWLKIRGFSVSVSILLTVGSIVLVWSQGANLLSAEFRGGTSVTIDLKSDAAGNPLKMERKEIQDRLEALARNAPVGDDLRKMADVEVIAVNPDANGKTASRFTIKTTITDPVLVQTTVINEFAKEVASRPAIGYAGAEFKANTAPALPILSARLAESLTEPHGTTEMVADFIGGVAITLDKIDPPQTQETLEQRLRDTRAQSDFSATLSRSWKVIPLARSGDALTAAAIVVRADGISYEDIRAWESQLRDREWSLTHAALARAQTLASVESFDSSLADSLWWRAIVALLLATLLVAIYIWVRFNSLRYSLAAIVTTLHDCVIAVGFVALANVLSEWNPGLARALYITPFKIDLNVMAAVLTILGFSLNGVIVVMDRVRENRGKLPYASRWAVNNAINQTFSRTLITTATTLFAVVTLYIWGGDAVRVFSYTLLVGVISATYSAIGVAPTLVWVRAADRDAAGSGSIPQAGRAAAA